MVPKIDRQSLEKHDIYMKHSENAWPLTSYNLQPEAGNSRQSRL